MLVNDWSLRNLIPAELAKGFGFLQSKPATAFSAVAVTPDELGGRVARRQGAPAARKRDQRPACSAIRMPGVDMNFSFYELIAHAARTRSLGAGTILGIRHRRQPRSEPRRSCLAERRTLEVLEYGSARTPFLKFGDRVRIEMLAESGTSIFGAIDQQVVRYRGRPIGGTRYGCRTYERIHHHHGARRP